MYIFPEDYPCHLGFQIHLKILQIILFKISPYLMLDLLFLFLIVLPTEVYFFFTL